MKVSTLEKRKGSLFDLPFLSSYLRLGSEQSDALKDYLEHLVEEATDWGQEMLGKTFLTQTIRVSHRNNEIILPYGPVEKENIQSVKRRGKILEKDRDYFLEHYKDTLKIKTAFSWKSPEIEVIYKAGYGDTKEDVPLVMRNSILRSLEALYNNGGDIEKMKKEASVMMSSYRNYCIG